VKNNYRIKLKANDLKKIRLKHLRMKFVIHFYRSGALCSSLGK
jgi:hypothetical protein